MKNTIKSIFTIIFIVNFTYSQSIVDKKRAISIIEDLNYNEYYFDIKCYDKSEISYDPLTLKIEINNFTFLGEENNINAKTTFYLTDLDLSTFKVEYFEMDDGLLFCSIRVKALKGSISRHIVTVNKKKHKYPNSDIFYYDELVFDTNRNLPKNQLDKLIANFKILLGINK